MSRAFPADDDKARVSIELFEALVTRLEAPLRHEVRFDKSAALEFPQIVASWLFGSLQRIRATSWGVISALNAPSEVLFVLSIRALLESAANLAHVESKLRQVYSGEFARKDMTYLAFRMKFATRKPSDMELSEDEAKRVSSVNVLTTMKSLDRFASTDLGFASPTPMTAWYERLSEFCHPNYLGNSLGSDLDFPGGVETFDVEPGIRPAVHAMFSNYAYVALYGFCILYNRCWEMLLLHEKVLPAWTPDGDPKISLD